jgi:hypothetical protein
MGLADYAPATIADFIDRKVNAAEAPIAAYLAEHAFMAQVVLAAQGSVVNAARAFPFVGDIAIAAVHPSETIHGWADMFRFGAGFAEAIEKRSVAPAARDVLRGANIVALLEGGRNMVATRVRLATGARTAALLRDVPGGGCAPVAATYVLRKNGRAPRINVADIVVAHGGDPAVLADYELGRAGVLRALDELNIPYRTLPNPATMEELERIVRAAKQDVIFGVRITAGPEAGVRHAMVAFIDDAGQFRIWDRTGNVVSTLAELEQRAGYQGLGTATPSGADASRPLILIEGLSVARTAARTAVLTLVLSTLLAVSRQHADPQMVAEGIESSYQRAAGTIPATLPSVPILGAPKVERRRVAPRADWLTGVKYRLNHLGYGAGPIAHGYDHRSKAAVRAFQHDYRLRVDGIPGPITQGRLVAVCGY